MDKKKDKIGWERHQINWLEILKVICIPPISLALSLQLFVYIHSQITSNATYFSFYCDPFNKLRAHTESELFYNYNQQQLQHELIYTLSWKKDHSITCWWIKKNMTHNTLSKCIYMHANERENDSERSVREIAP